MNGNVLEAIVGSADLAFLGIPLRMIGLDCDHYAHYLTTGQRKKETKLISHSSFNSCPLLSSD